VRIAFASSTRSGRRAVHTSTGSVSIILVMTLLCDSQFDKCLHSGNKGVTIGTLYYLARDNGIDISKLQTAPKPSPPSTQLTLLSKDP